MVGHRWEERAQHLRDSFTRNRIPLGFYEAESDEGRALLEDLHLESPKLPVVELRFRPERPVLQNPSDIDIASAFGLFDAPDPAAVLRRRRRRVRTGRAGRERVRRLGGPLATLVLEHEAVGGQAGTSSLIRNYAGFRNGISGNKLAFTAFQQAWTFGSTFHFMRAASGLDDRRGRAAPARPHRRHVRARPHRGHRDRCRVAAGRRAGAGGTDRQGRLLRRGGHRGARDARPARVRRRRRATRPGRRRCTSPGTPTG